MAYIIFDHCGPICFCLVTLCCLYQNHTSAIWRAKWRKIVKTWWIYGNTRKSGITSFIWWNSQKNLIPRKFWILKKHPVPGYINSWWLRCKNEFLKNNSVKNRIESLEKKIRQTIDRHSLWKPLIPKNIFRFCTLCPQFFAYLFLSPSFSSTVAIR